MPTTITEGRLKLPFGDRWQVVKYDEEPCYLAGLERLKGMVDGKTRDSSAVDVVGRRCDELFIVEIKDFR